MSVWKKGEEICSSQHVQVLQSCCFPSSSTCSGDQLLSTPKRWVCWVLPEHKEMLLKGWATDGIFFTGSWKAV